MGPGSAGGAAFRFGRWCILLSGAALLAPQHAGAMRTTVEADGLPQPWTPLLSGVGLAPGAALRVRLHTLMPSPNASVVLFTEAQMQLLAPMLAFSGIGGGSFHHWVSITYTPCTWRASLAGAVDATREVRAREAERYFLGVLQAVPGAARGLRGEVGFTNPGGSELPVQQRATPAVWLCAACAFAGSAAALLALVATRRRARLKLHALLLVAAVSKCLVLLLIRGDVQALGRTGHPAAERRLLWQLLRQVHMNLEVVCFYVIGLGWKVMRAQLRSTEWAFVGAVCGLSFALGVAEVLCSDHGGCSSHSYVLTQFTMHSLCFLVVIIATNFNIFTLQRQVGEALASPGTSALYAKHRAYCWFRGFFLFFVVVPTVTNFLALHVVRWDQLWVVVLVREGSLWLIYTAVLWLFRPGFLEVRVFEMAVVDVSDGSSSE